jgi:hypothetical protein
MAKMTGIELRARANARHAKDARLRLEASVVRTEAFDAFWRKALPEIERSLQELQEIFSYASICTTPTTAFAAMDLETYQEAHAIRDRITERAERAGIIPTRKRAEFDE